MLALIFFIVLIALVFLVGVSALRANPIMSADLIGILRARDHDQPFQRGPHIRFDDAVQERIYSKSTGQVGPARKVLINDKSSVRLTQESYPRDDL